MTTATQGEVFAEILAWSKTQPAWQRDALRRLFVGEKIGPNEVAELAEMAKGAVGLATAVPPVVPLSEEHLPVEGLCASVELEHVEHVCGVNALAEGQTLSFGPSLNVVFGSNGAGKSGYTRVLKHACRARSVEPILSNATSEAAPKPPTALIGMRVDGASAQPVKWSDRKASDPRLGLVSVFDGSSSAVYLTKSTEVAFRPFGLDCLDGLATASEGVRSVLDKERRLEASSQVALPPFGDGTRVQRLVSNLTLMSSPDEVRAMASLSANEEAEWALTVKRLADLSADDPDKRARSLLLLAQKAERMLALVRAAGDLLGRESTTQIRDAADAARRTRNELGVEIDVLTRGTSLAGVGSNEWRTMWDAAETYSKALAYPGEPFPVTEPEARCVLCTQELGPAARGHFEHALAHVASTLSARLRSEERRLSDYKNQLARLDLDSPPVAETIAELEVEDPRRAGSLREYLVLASASRADLVSLLDGNAGQTTSLDQRPDVVDGLRSMVDEIRSRAATLRDPRAKEVRVSLQSAVREFEARRMLATHLSSVLESIERLKRLAAYDSVISTTDTTQLTKRSTALTKRVVTAQLAESFQDELTKLGFQQLEVSLVADRGQRGSLRHKLTLDRAPHANVATIASEGEQRAMALATFFSELVTADHRSAIVFDDPVSSLDHRWRRKIAARLANEAKERQVIVFTHDIVFLHLLATIAEQEHVNVTHNTLDRDQLAGAGVVSPEISWEAGSVKDRIKRLRARLQDAQAELRRGQAGRFQEEGRSIYRALRDTWERAVEEVLLNGAVGRYVGEVATKRIAKLVDDISQSDYETIETGMSSCSVYSHDSARALGPVEVDAAELEQEIDRLAEWVKAVWKRRE